MRLTVTGMAAILCVLLSLCAVRAAVADTSPSPASTAPAASPQDTAARAKDWLHRLQTGDIDRAQLTAQMSAALSPDKVTQISSQFAPLGDPASFTFLEQQPVPSDPTMTAYVYRVVFKTTTLNEIFSLDKDGKVAGILFQPAQ